MSKLRLLTIPAVAVAAVLTLSALGLARQDEEKQKEKETKEAPPVKPEALAARVKEIFRGRCFECHGGPNGTQAGIKVLERASLNRKIKPGNPDGSKLIKTLTAKDDNIMPPAGKPPLTADEIDVVRAWIAAGAPDYPQDAPKPVEKAEAKDASFKRVVGVDYVMKSILKHVRSLPEEDLAYVRYFSINHLLFGDATPAWLQTHRDTFVKAINHLSWETEVVHPEPIDPPHNTVFAVDIRKLGWSAQPYQVYGGRNYKGTPYKSYLNLYDLALLEYPYAAFYQNSPTYNNLLREYMKPARLARPIPYVRADWFCSVITQPPLYEDVMMMPYKVQELEEYLGIDAAYNLKTYRARRAGMTVSGVSRNNRVVERHPMGKGGAGAYWKSYDFKSSRGEENMFKDPIYFRESGGEMIFNLPNGLQGYYVADAKGNRLEAAPTEIVTDKNASDKVVRNGLACIRCHDQGMKHFDDVLRPALETLPDSPVAFDPVVALRLYAPKKEMEGWLKKDTERFLTALKTTLGKEQGTEEPLIPVSKRFLDDPLTLATAAHELGLNEYRDLVSIFKTPGFSTLGLVPLSAGGVVRRDAWEDYYDRVVQHLGLGRPIVPLDGLNRQDYPAGRTDLAVELKALGGTGNVFKEGQKLTLAVTNKSHRRIYIELIGTSAKGRKVILTNGVIPVEPGKTWERGPLAIRGEKGKEQISVLASYEYFPPGQLLRGPEKGRYVTDRVVHPFYTVDMRGDRPYLLYDATSMVKKSIEIETK